MSFLLAATGTGTPFSGVTTDGVTILGDGFGVPLTAVTNQTGKNLISGGIAWSGTGYVFDVSTLTYTFDGVFYSAGPTQVTLGSADPTNNRFDAVVVDEAGNVAVITGTASANPEFPTIPDDQLAVGYVLVEAASTSPSILQDNIYFDNTEWTTSTYTTGGGSIGSIDFDSTDAPKEGTKCAKATGTNLRLGMKFTRGTAIDLQTFGYVQIWARLTNTVATNKQLNVRFDNSLGNPVGNTVSLFNYGMSRTITGTWQLVVIPVSAFGAITNIKGLRAIMAGGLISNTATWSLDFMLLSGAILPQGLLGPIYLSPSNTLYSTGAATGATAVTDSIFFGPGAGFQAVGADSAIFLGKNAGSGAGYATNSTFIGENSGFLATNSDNSVFIGTNSGYLADDAEQSVFLGINSGSGATHSSRSQFFGYNSGFGATDAPNSNFFGFQSGYQAINAAFSNFIGTESGSGATDASNSFFSGYQSGKGATKANNAIFFGYRSGNADTVDNSLGGTSILIGDNTSTGGFSNSIGLGEGATNTAVNQLMIGSATTPINQVIITGTGGVQVPVGTTGERIATQGMIRYNTTTSKFEGYTGGAWVDFH